VALFFDRPVPVNAPAVTPQALFDRLVESSGVKEVCSPDRMLGRVQRILLHGASHLGSGFLETSKPTKIETGWLFGTISATDLCTKQHEPVNYEVESPTSAQS
jgi:hypothetical protein